MEQGSLKQRTVAGVFWKILENGGTTAITFIVTVLLARLLTPESYGVLSITIIFVTITGVFVQKGFNLALVQKTDADELDFSSAFWFSLLLAGALYAALWFASPFIARFYSSPDVAPVLRVISLILFPAAISSLQYALIMRRFAFRKRFIVTLISTCLSGTVGITMAIRGYGVWALVARQLVDDFTICVGMCIATKWLPQLRFSMKRLGALFSFGWKLLVSSLLETLYSDISSLIIGKRFNTTMLAQYDKGRRFPMNITTTLSGGIQVAMFPSLSIAQKEPARLLAMTRRSVSVSTFVIAPLVAGLAAVSTPLVRLVLLPKWLPCVPFLMVFCITYALFPIDTAVTQPINALGRSDVYLKLEIAKKLTGLVLIVLAVFVVGTPLALAWALAATAALSIFYNALPAKRLLGYRLTQLLSDVLPQLLLSLVMFAAVYAVGFLGLSDRLTLLIQIPAGMLLYAGLAALLRLSSFTYLWTTIREMRSKRRGKSAPEGEDIRE